jgi:hypothetical protein
MEIILFVVILFCWHLLGRVGESLREPGHHVAARAAGDTIMVVHRSVNTVVSEALSVTWALIKKLALGGGGKKKKK